MLEKKIKTQQNMPEENTQNSKYQAFNNKQFENEGF